MNIKKTIRFIFSAIVVLIIASLIFFPQQVSDKIVMPLVLKFSQSFSNKMVDAYNEVLDLDMSHVEMDTSSKSKEE